MSNKINFNEIEKRRHLKRMPKDKRRIEIFGEKVIPEDICQLKDLEEIYIDEIRSKEIIFPEQITSLKSLNTIHIHDTDIEEIPEIIFSIPNIRKLCLGGNKINKISPKISQLIYLEELMLGRNSFEEFPEELFLLENLEKLNLSDNNLKTLPNKAKQLKGLISFNLERNPFQVPKEIFSNKPIELIQYILDYQNAKNTKPLLEAKLIFIGSGGVGKSSLIQYLVSNHYTPNLGKTDGIEISDWSVNRKGDKIKIHIWDFGGQEIMHATHKFFMTSRSAYVLVINPRTEDKYGESELEYWLKLIRSYAGIVPIVVAINKCEVHQISLAKEELLSKYPNIIGFIETSCEESIGIAELKKCIEKAIGRLDHIDDKLPITYFKIKTNLEKINKDYIEYSDYENICRNIDPFFETESKATLVGLLHDLGVMLNFREDRMLQDTQVLNPEWVTQGVYQLINYNNLIKNKGILSSDELENILDSKKYPTAKERFFITDIMGHFELSFQLEGTPNKYFIPGAFPKDKPSFTWSYELSNLLLFQYDYDVLPSSIFSRFMVKVHRLIRGTDFWLNGVVIQFENCEALIRADFEEKIIKIDVGGSGNRRALLSIIREKFESIHNNFNDIYVEQFIPVDTSGGVLTSYDKLILYEQAKEEEIFIPELRTRFKVRHLLDGIEEEDIRKHKIKNIQMEKGVSMFISYSHADEGLKDKLKTHLANLVNNKKITTWDDREIPAGDEWEEEINHFLKTSEFILLLISSDFLASKYCTSVELKIAIDRHNKKEAVVIPILLRSCDWSDASFGKLQGLPKDMKPVTSWNNQDEAFTDIVKGISRRIDKYLKT